MGIYPPTEGYAKHFHCLTFGLNTTSMQMYWTMLNRVMDMQQSHTNLSILNMVKNY